MYENVLAYRRNSTTVNRKKCLPINMFLTNEVADISDGRAEFLAKHFKFIHSAPSPNGVMYPLIDHKSKNDSDVKSHPSIITILSEG